MYETGNLWWHRHNYQVLNLKKRTFDHQNLLGAHEPLDTTSLLWPKTMQHDEQSRGASNIRTTVSSFKEESPRRYLSLPTKLPL